MIGGGLALAAMLAAASVHADFATGRKAYDAFEFEKARKEFAGAAANGNAEAAFLLAGMAAGGVGGPKDEREAFKWYLQAAEAGNVAAQAEAARRYSTAQGVAKNDERSLYWARIAADKGDARSQYIMGIRHVEAIGVKRYLVEAVLWLGRSSEQGYAPAQIALADMLARAAENTKGNTAASYRVEAMKWYVLAATQGSKEAEPKMLPVKARMSADELSEAERRTRAWRAVKQGQPNAKP